MRFHRRVALSLLLVTAAPTAHADVVFVVDSSADTSDASNGDALCDDGSGKCTLRAAIEEANATVGQDRIEFAIPGSGPHTIATDSLDIQDSVEIDGTTQAGSSVNTAATGTNAVLGIVITGAGFGLSADAPNVEIRGVGIIGFQSADSCLAFGPLSTGSRLIGSRVSGCNADAILVAGSRVRIGGPALSERNLVGDNRDGIVVSGNDNFVLNNLIGTDPTGTLPFGNANWGIDLAGDRNAVTDNVIAQNGTGVSITGDGNTLVRNRVGGVAGVLGNGGGVQVLGGTANHVGLPHTTVAQGNEVVGNGYGIRLSGGGGNFVQGNRIGLVGGSILPNSGTALEIIDSSGNTIGGSSAAANEIAFNGSGVFVIGSAIDNSIRANRIWSNDDYDLDLGLDGIDNDDAQFGLPPDYDEGPNHLQNPPHLTSISIAQGQTTIAGNIDAQAGLYTIDFFSNTSCTGVRRGGEFYLGAALLNATGTAQSPNTTFTFTLPVTAQGSGFTATATDVDGNTSEFSNCFSAAFAGGADLVLNPAFSYSRALNPGDAVRFAVRILNRGPFVAINTPVVVTTPPGFLSAWTPDPANVSRFDLTSGTWTVPSLAVGASALLELDATIEPAAGGEFTTQAEALLGLSAYDPNILNNSATQTGIVRSGADLVVSQVAPSSAVDNDVVSFDVTVTNTGPQNASSVMLTGTLDDSLVFVGSSEPPPRFSFTPAATRPCVICSPARWTWDAGDLANLGSATLRVDARAVAALVGPDFGFKHTVSASASAPRDPLPTLSTKVVGLGAFADLTIAQLNSTGNAPDQDWTVAVRNFGPDPAAVFVLQVDSCDGVQAVIVEDQGVPLCRGACPLSCRVATPLAANDIRHLHVKEDLGFSVDLLSVRLEPDASVPFYDPSPASATWLRGAGSQGSSPGGYHCGLLGIESPLFLGLIILLRGRKGRAAFRRMFPGSVLALALLLGGSAQSAQAATLTLAVDSVASSASVAITSSLGSPAPAPVSLSGSVDADVALTSDALFGLVAESLQLTGGAIAFSNSSIVLESFPLYDLTFSWNGIVAGAAGPAASGFPVAPGLSLFDLVGSSLSFGAGTIDATGSYFGLPVGESLDLAALPFGSTFPANSVAQLEVTDLGGGIAALRLTLPFTATLRLTIDTQPVIVTIAGTLVLAGQSVPEPSAALLLGAAGLLGLAFWSERRLVIRTDDNRRCHAAHNRATT